MGDGVETGEWSTILWRLSGNELGKAVTVRFYTAQEFQSLSFYERARERASKTTRAGVSLRARRVSRAAFVCATKEMVALDDAQTAAMKAFLKARRGDKEFSRAHPGRGGHTHAGLSCTESA